MTRTIPSREQLDLLDWSAPETVAAFDPFLIRANNFGGRLSRSISISLDTCGLSRSEVADRMSVHSGSKVSLNILNAYASVARDGHQISVPRFEALMAATRDRRLAQVLVDDHGWAVIEKRYLPMIEIGMLTEQKTRLAARERALRSQARRGM